MVINIKNVKNMAKIYTRFEIDKSQKCLSIYNAWRYCFETNLKHFLGILFMPLHHW